MSKQKDAEPVKLKPCPFCGAVARLPRDDSNTVHCVQCGGIGPSGRDADEAVWWWNRRRVV